MSTVVVSNSCNPYTITKIFICTALVLVGMGILLVNALSNFDTYKETISSQIFMVLLMVFNEFLFCFIILFNSYDLQQYVKRKFLSFPNFFFSVIAKRNEIIESSVVTLEPLPDDIPLTVQNEQDIENLKTRLMMHIRIEYTVKNCLQSIFNIYEMSDFVKRGVKQIPINKMFTESEIEKLANMYPKNTIVYDLLSQYCLLPENMYPPNKTQHSTNIQRKEITITIHQ